MILITHIRSLSMPGCAVDRTYGDIVHHSACCAGAQDAKNSISLGFVRTAGVLIAIEECYFDEMS
jgi:hypothetical protein